LYWGYTVTLKKFLKYIIANISSAILNKQKCLFFSKTENRKVKQALCGWLVPVGGGGSKERVEEVNVAEMSCTQA
jgi:hypothetical protein